MRKLKWIILIVLVLVVVVIGGVWLSLDQIIKTAVETEGTASLKCQTTLGGVSLSILGQSLALSDLEIGSPNGFSAPHLLTLGGSQVNVSVGQLRQQPIHIANVELTDPVLTIEQANGKLNFQALSDQSASSSGGGTASTSSSSMKIIIDHLKISGAHVIIRPGLPGLTTELNVPLQTLDIQNVGTGDGNQNGMAIKDVVFTIIGSMAGAATNSDMVPPELKSLLKLNVGQFAQQLGGDLQKQVGNLGNLGETLTKQLPGDLGKNIGTAGKDVGNNVGNAMKGLLGGDKKQGQ